MGAQHFRVNLVAAVISSVGLIAFQLLSIKDALIFGSSLVFGTVFLSPDLDLLQSRSTSSWGGFRWIWLGYSRLFRHRYLSHVPIVGLGTRLLYLLVALCIAYFLGDLLYSGVLLFEAEGASPSILVHGLETAITDLYTLQRSAVKFLADNSKEVVTVLAAICCADLLHVGCDILASMRRKSSRKSN